MLRAGGWNLAGYGLSKAIRLASNLVMTRLLVPEMFGVMAIAIVVPTTLLLLSDIGLRQNIVQSRRGDDPAFLDTVWVVQIVRGLILCLLTLGLSIALHLANLGGLFPASSVYESPDLPLVIAVFSLTAISSGFESTKWPTAFRHFNQKRIVQIELIAQVIATAIMIVIGAVTRSIWALVTGGLLASLITTVLSHTWMSGHPNRFRWEKNALRELIDFGKWIFVSSATGVLAGSGASLLFAGFVEAEVLGLFAIASLILGALGDALGRLYGMVSLPALSEIVRNDPSKLREIYYKMRVPGDLLLLFLAGLLFTSGQLVIDLLYDPRYSEAGGILQVLALSYFSARYGVAQQIYLALGKPRYLAVLNIVSFVSLFSVVPLLYYLAGTQGAIWGMVLYTMVVVPFIFFFNARLGLNDYRRELVVLVALPVGWVCGTGLNLILG